METSRQYHFEEGETLLINKPYAWTSFDVIGKMRVILKYRIGLKKVKTGHAGTLDPLATGLLIVCTGKFTKRIDEFQGMEKEYTGTFRMGATTPSFDMETDEDAHFDYSHLTESLINQSAQKFVGELMQEPPIFSAVKIDGKRAYEHARKGRSVLLEPRKITISEFEITRIALPDIDFRIVCSKGTYIRALARDYGTELNCGAYLSALCRTRIGIYRLSDAMTMDEFETSVQPLIQSQ
ncbi:MAG: tRNA pseudouridine(55) synthase TruB [Bacteroidota bacterium]